MSDGDDGSFGPESPGPAGGESGPTRLEAADAPAPAADARRPVPRTVEEFIAATADDPVPDDEDPWSDVGDPAADYDEADLAAEYDGDSSSLTAEDHAPDTGDDHAPDNGAGNQDLPEGGGEAPPAAEEPDPLPEDSGASAATAPEHEDGNATGHEPSPTGVTADTGSAADTGERSAEAPQAGQADALTGQAGPDENRAGLDVAPDAALKALWAKFEARLEQQDAKNEARFKQQEAKHEADLKEQGSKYEAKLEEQSAENEARVKALEAEVKALKDNRQAGLDAPGNTEVGDDQPNATDRKRTTARMDATEAEAEGDRPGLWSNAKTALYGGVASVGAGFAFSEFFPNVPSSVVVVATGAMSIASLLVPVLREARKGKHDHSPDKR